MRREPGKLRLGELSKPEGSFQQRTELTFTQQGYFKARDLKAPPRIFRVQTRQQAL